MKKIVALFAIMMLITGFLGCSYVEKNAVLVAEIKEEQYLEEQPELKEGDYFKLGKYYDNSIVWRYTVEDKIGKLILSDKVLCFKVFGTDNYWEESFLRTWLNSTADEGEVDWTPLAGFTWTESYLQEKGFLNHENFTAKERSVMREVTQWTMLPENRLEKSTNGQTEAFDAVKDVYWNGNPRNEPQIIYYSIPELPEVYHGAANQITDTVFLLDEMQLYNIWKTYGSIEAKRTDESIEDTPNDGMWQFYWLRSSSGVCVTSAYNTEGYLSGSSLGNGGRMGVRPAFYLNEENAVILSGSGTEEDPYVLDGKENGDISVYCNEEKLWFDQPPIMENNRVLVPLRVIFETLGADIEWDGTTQTVTAVRGETNISLQIDSNMMYKNGEVIELDVPARLLNDRTLVPIRAVSEAMEAKVEWIQKDKTVVITTQ